MKKLALLLFIAVLLTACSPAATPQPTSIPPTAILPTEKPALTPTSVAIESIATSTSDLIGVWLFAESGLKLKFEADGSYRVFSGSETIDEGDYTFDTGKITWVTGHPTCGDKPATYEAYIAKRDDKPVSLRLQVVGSDPCPDRAGVTSDKGKFLSP